MKSLADRFRHWFSYEQACNALCVQMLNSVPLDRQGTPEFRKAVDKLSHLMAARLRWLQRLGAVNEAPPAFPTDLSLADLSAQIAAMESHWITYLERLDDTQIGRDVTYKAN
ncbi:MAG: DinB family protein [Planctomycetes bacterium]|nr:DinB family protein [Planctomycetota bacterium]